MITLNLLWRCLLVITVAACSYSFFIGLAFAGFNDPILGIAWWALPGITLITMFMGTLPVAAAISILEISTHWKNFNALKKLKKRKGDWK